jgi:putative membrane protein
MNINGGFQQKLMAAQFNIKRIILRLAINIIAILIAVTIVPGIDLVGPWWSLAVVALLFGLINTALRPLLMLLSLPFLILTLGFFMLLINAALLYLTSWMAQGFGIAFIIEGLGQAVLGALVISVVSGLLTLLSGDSRVQFQVVRGHREE